MEYIRFGHPGMKVSRGCLGCMSFGQRADSRPVWALDGDASRGVTKDSHLDDAVASLDVHLTDAEITYLEEPYVPQIVVGLDES